MKYLLFPILLGLSLFANGFEKNKVYNCINTYNMEQGQKVLVKDNEAKDKPFIFTLKENKLITKENVIFDFKMKRGEMLSYSNSDYMLLLMANNSLGLVPKKARGQLQFYFSCKK